PNLSSFPSNKFLAAPVPSVECMYSERFTERGPFVTALAEAPPPRPPAKRRLWLAYVVWLILGVVGGHRFYLGHYFTGFIYLISGGLYGIGWLVDGVMLPWIVRRVNDRKQRQYAEALDVGAPARPDERPLAPAARAAPDAAVRAAPSVEALPFG